MSRQPDETSAFKELMESGAAALGATAGTVVGQLIAGAPGALAGSAAGVFLEDGMRGIAGQIAAQFPTRTERERMGSAYLLARAQIVKRLDDGASLRSERFFQPRARKQAKALRSEAEELLEGTFLAARNAYEERKVQLLANFYSNVVFREDLDTAHANYILSLLESLTYRQLVTLIIIGNGELSNVVRTRDFRNSGPLTSLQLGVLFEVYQLIGLGLLSDKEGGYILGIADIVPSRLQLQGTGAEINNLLNPLALDFADFGYFINAFQPDF